MGSAGPGGPHRRQDRCTTTREAAALDAVLAQCPNTATEPIVCSATPARRTPAIPATSNVLPRYDDNRDGRIWCSEARRHGIAPVRRSHPAYRYMRDGDGDGVVCE